MPKAEFPNKFPPVASPLVSAASDSAFGAASHRKLGVVGVMFFRLGYSLTSPLRLKYTKMPKPLEHMIGHLALEKVARQLLKVLSQSFQGTTGSHATSFHKYGNVTSTKRIASDHWLGNINHPLHGDWHWCDMGLITYSILFNNLLNIDILKRRLTYPPGN